MNDIKLNNQIIPIVVSAGFCDNADYSFLGSSVSDYNTLLYITGDRLLIYEDETEYKLSKGSLIILHHGCSHTIKNTHSHNKTSLYYINFYMKENKTEFESVPPQVYNVPKIINGVMDSILNEKIRNYIEFFHLSERTPDLDINTRFYDVLSECVKLNREYRPSTIKLSKEIINYLEEHLDQPLNTKDMEKRFYLTYKYMGTAFKKESGSTILQYHTMLRMNHASRLLIMTQYSIDEISQQLGYADALYFSRVFKKNCGLSPQIFRKAHLADRN